MPRGKRSNTSDAQPTKGLRRYDTEAEAPWGGFLNARMDVEHKARFTSWFEEKGQLFWTSLDDAVSEGLKYSLAYDAENEAYVATLTGRLCASLKSRWAASARAGTWEEATALVLFKHYVLAEGNWDDFRPSRGDFMKWG